LNADDTDAHDCIDKKSKVIILNQRYLRSIKPEGLNADDTDENDLH